MTDIVERLLEIEKLIQTAPDQKGIEAAVSSAAKTTSFLREAAAEIARLREVEKAFEKSVQATIFASQELSSLRSALTAAEAKIVYHRDEEKQPPVFAQGLPGRYSEHLTAERANNIFSDYCRVQRELTAAHQREREACIAECQAERDRPRFNGESAQWSEGSITCARAIERRIRARAAGSPGF